jgi:GWxTD domain-containing protein
VLYLVRDERNQELLRSDHTLPTDQKWIRYNEKIDKKILQEGNYLLTLIIETNEGKTELNKKFQVIWFEKPLYLYDNELAVPPLKYIISQEEWDALEDLSDEKLSAWIKEFWKKKDPDPDTPLNEIMVEFYERVLQANKKFAGEYTEGWTTDRGKSLILYGEPDRVDAYRYNLKSKPYEIWYYESENKKLIFIDVDEDDSYPLMSVEDIGESENE